MRTAFSSSTSNKVSVPRNFDASRTIAFDEAAHLGLGRGK
jgi:hypothetical protein